MTRSGIRALGLLLLVSSMTAAGTTDTFSHEAWGEVLERFVDERGLVDYQGLAEDRESLDRYLAAIASHGPSASPDLFPTRDHELAFYINGYNALVFEGVLSRGPEKKSVWTGGPISGLKFFAMTRVRIDATTTNLRKLENGTIREIYQDPRIHAALNCASMGCPRLPRGVFDPDRLDEQLDAAMREFVNEPRNVRVNEAERTVQLSKIFDWFEGDFIEYERSQGNSRPGLLDYLNRYRAKDAHLDADLELVFSKYDKRVNSQGQQF